YLEKFAQAGIKINAQLVLCPGINDGEELKYSVRELSRLYPELESIACVPVGITKYREGLCKLEGYDEKNSGEVIDIIEELAEENKKIYGDRIVYPADEFFIKSGRKMPEDEYYGDYNQLENGVGMCAMLKSEFTAALDSAEAKEISRNVTIATGVAAAPMIENFAKMAEEKFSGLKLKVYGIENKFFGETITVAGLLTGKDIFEALRGKPLGDEVLISKSMLRSDDIFLDDMSRTELEKRLGVKITATENDGFELLRAMTGEET
ncbi:MAG: DUF512 domain-containing protein, partial [Oscillospiraceae bacterium]|nr:DUF512 domain-containing protein [Oscillospiraceae bacterium]